MELFYRLLSYSFFTQQKKTYLEITPLDVTLKTPLATNELLTILHTLSLPRVTFFSRFNTRKTVYSLELVATKERGIRYVVCIPTADSPGVKKTFYSYLPGIQIQEIEDYLPVKPYFPDTLWSFQEMKLSNHFVFPLSHTEYLSQHDPIAYVTGAMTKLKHNEMVTLQLVVSPVSKYTHSKTTHEIVTIRKYLEEEFPVFHLLTKSNFIVRYIKIILLPVFISFALIRILLLLLLDLLFLPLMLILFLVTFGKTRLFPFLFPASTETRVPLTTAQRELYQAINSKLQKEMFEVSFRFFLISNNETSLRIRTNSLLASLASFSNHNQSFIPKSTGFLFRLITNNLNLYRFKNRLHALRENPILTVDELTSIYHLPSTDSVKTEGLQKVKSKMLPVPTNTANNFDEFSCIVGRNNYGDEQTVIGLTKKERARHIYILGATGTGKSTMLRSLINNDLLLGNGICVIDPHGDLVEKVVGDVPKERMRDVIFFNPFDIENPVGLNLLELPKNLTDIQREREKDLIASSLISIFSKLYPPASWGTRLEYILRNATLTALTTPEPTLFTIQRMLVEYQYRKDVVDKLTDPILHLFWKKEFAGLGSYQKAAVVTPVTNKIGRFLSSPHSRYILGQKKSTIDFAEILDQGKILLCDLSKGKIGEDTSTLFGAFITAKIQLTALRRATMSEDQRRPFYLYIDEFQNFATSSFAQIMSEARKYGLNAILAHQTIAQIADRDLVQVILANTGTVICFRTGSPLDEEFILPYFTPLVEKGEIANLPNYRFYIKINAVEPQDAFSGESIALETPPDEVVKETIIEYSKAFYTFPWQQVEEEITTTYFQSMQEQLAKKEEKERKRLEMEEAKKKEAELKKLQNGIAENGVKQTNGVEHTNVVAKNGKVN